MREIAAESVYPIDDLSPSGDAGVSPNREVRSTDISKISLTAPMVFALTVSVGSLIGAFWSLKSGDDAVTQEIQSDVRDIRTRMEFQEKLNEERFAALKAQVEAAGLRNANMSLVQELQKQQTKQK